MSLRMLPRIPLMALYNTFRDELGIRYPALGHALWNPDPGVLDPPVEVGDVGYIREGKFHRLFNALLSGDHPSHVRYGVPADHEPLQQILPNHIDRGTLAPNDLHSYGVTVASGGLQALGAGVGSAEVTFSCTTKQGAVLSLPVTARREDTTIRSHFGKWMIRKIDSWFAFAQQLGLGVGMEDIALVTGCHRTKSWTNITFDDAQADARFSLRVDVDAFSASVDWGVSNFHIPGMAYNQGPSGRNLPENQCIFLRGFRVKRTFRILPRLRGAAEPNPDARGNDREPEKETVTMPSVSEPSDPLHILLEYIANRTPDCDMVVVHDDDLERILRLGNKTSLKSLQSHDMMNYLKRSKPRIEVMSDSLPTDYPSPRTDAGRLRVAMLSEQLKSLDPPAFVPVLSHLSVGATNREERAHCLLEVLEDTAQSLGEKDGNVCAATC